MNTTEQLRALQGNIDPHVPVGSGVPTRVWIAEVKTVHTDGTVDCQPISGRGTKVNVPTPDSYAATLGDRVIVTNLGGDPQRPCVIAPLTRNGTAPAVTGSRSGGDALTNLLSVLATAGLIEDHTTA